MSPWLLLSQLTLFDSAGPLPALRGPPATRFRVQRLMDAVHVNRVEGLYTGWGVEHRARGRATGLVLQANAGWAWTEQAARGRGSATLTRGRWIVALRAGRTLDVTNDFRTAFDSGSAFGALVTADNYDYVDRRLAAVGLMHRFGRSAGFWRIESGPAHDAGARRTIDQGVYSGDSLFRENRGVRRGSYWRTMAALEWHPLVSSRVDGTGLDGMLMVEQAVGAMDYTRLEGRLAGRRARGPLVLAGRLDAGSVLGDSPPPQQLFEIGRNQGLQAYSYKEFVGDQAAVARALAMLRLPFLQAPFRLRGRSLPALAPALSAGVQGAWTALRGSGARQANTELWQPLRAPTGGIRASLTIGMRFFGGVVGAGAARPLDHPGPWRLRVEFGHPL
jgi:hypothetical protein